MKTLFTSIILIASTLFVTAGTTITGNIHSGGLVRTYRLYVPTGYNASTAVPLILNIHGYTSNATDQQNYTNFMPIADTAHFLMVYPQGTTDTQGSTYWNSGFSLTAVDDITFLSNLIDTLKASYNIDMNRVYSTGFSNGGFMSNVLACALGDRIAAIAPVSGTFFTYISPYPYTPTKAIPVMHIHGTMDGTVPIAGTTDMISADSAVSFWVNNNNCNTTPVHTTLANTNLVDGSTAEHYVYSNGTNGTTVEYYKIIGGAHTWPGSPYTIGTTNQDMSASKEIWRFFRQYSLSQATRISSIDNLKSSFSIYPNPSKQRATLVFNDKTINKVTVTIYNTIGEEVFKKLISANEELNLSELKTGVYSVSVVNGTETSSQKLVVE